MALALLWIFRLLLMLLGLVGLAGTVVPGISTNTWWIRTFDFARLQTLIVGVVVTVLLLLSWRHWPGLLLAGLLAAACAYNAFVLYPYAPVRRPEMLGAASCPEANRLRLLEVNVQMTNTHDERLLDLVRQVKPDVAWFQETDAWWTQELAALADTMPYHIGHAQPNYFGVDLYSRFPLVDPEIKHLTNSADPAVFTGVTLPSGQTIRLYAIHPRPPQEGQSTAERDGQILAAALAAHDDQVPHIMTGDLNSVPWEDVVRLGRRVGRFLDPRLGRGLYITWNAKSAVLKWPLDQILPGPEFTLMSLQVLPRFGSDHRPFWPNSASTRRPPRGKPPRRCTPMISNSPARQCGSGRGRRTRRGSDAARRALCRTEAWMARTSRAMTLTY